MVAEETVMICIDTSQWTDSCLNRYSYELQFECIQSYCRSILESSNPTYAVGIATMGTLYKEWVNDTSDLDKVLRHLKHNVIVDGEFNFLRAFTTSLMKLLFYHPSERKRMLFFIGGPTNLDAVKAKAFGESLKEDGVAVDVVNFCQSEKEKEILDILVNTVNDNSHIRHIQPDSCTQVHDVLSSPEAIIIPAALLKEWKYSPQQLELEFKFEADEETNTNNVKLGKMTNQAKYNPNPFLELDNKIEALIMKGQSLTVGRLLCCFVFSVSVVLNLMTLLGTGQSKTSGLT